MRYTLPEALGGGEVEVVSKPWSGHAINCEVTLVSDPQVRIAIARALLTEVPLEEPPPGYYLIDYDERAYPTVAEHEEGYGWHVAGSGDGHMWDEVVARHPGAMFTRLVPDPFAEPVALPWEANDDGADATEADARHRRVEVAMSAGSNTRKDVIVRVHVGSAKGIALSHSTARAMARALMAAADAAEKEQS